MSDINSAIERAHQDFHAAANNFDDVSNKGQRLLDNRNDMAVRSVLDEANGQLAQHRSGIVKITGNMTADSVLSSIMDTVETASAAFPGARAFFHDLKSDPDRAYFGPKGTFFRDSFMEPTIGPHATYQAYPIETTRPVAVVGDDYEVTRILKIPHSHTLMNKQFFQDREFITEKEYEDFKGFVERDPRLGGRGEDIGTYLTSSDLVENHDLSTAFEMVRANGRLGQAYLDGIAAMKVRNRIMGNSLDPQHTGNFGEIGHRVNDYLRPFTTKVQHFLESFIHSAQQTIPMSVRGFANYFGPEGAEFIDELTEELLGEDWSTPYQQMVEYEGSEFLESLGTAGGQLAIQLTAGRLLAPAKLGFLSFAGLGAGYVQGITQKTRYEYYLRQGKTEDEARRLALIDGAAAGGITFASEMIVGGIGKFANKSQFVRNLGISAEAYAIRSVSPAGLVFAGTREAQQEIGEEILQRAYFMTVRDDPEMRGEALFSEEFLEQLKTVGLVSFVTGGAGGTISNMQMAMSLAPAEVGATVQVRTGELIGNTGIRRLQDVEVTEENVASLNYQLRKDFIEQVRLNNNAPLGGPLASVAIRGLHILNIRRSRKKFTKYLQRLGVPPESIERILKSVDANLDQTRSLSAIFGPSREKIAKGGRSGRRDPVTGKFVTGGHFASENKIDIARELPALAQFLDALTSNDKKAAIKAARLLSGNNQDLVEFLEGLSEEDLQFLREESARSLARAEADIEAAMTAGMTPAQAPDYFEDSDTDSDGVATDSLLDRVANEAFLAAQRDGASEEEAAAIADQIMQKLLYPEEGLELTAAERKLLDKVTKGNTEQLLGYVAKRGEQVAPTTEASEDTDVSDSDDDTPRFSRSSPEGAADTDADAAESGGSTESSADFETRLRDELRGEEGGTETLEVEVVPPDELTPDQKKMRDAYGKAGLRMVFFRTTDGGKAVPVPGNVRATVSDTGVVYVRASETSTTAILDSLVAHEIFHAVFRQDRQAAADFMQAALEHDKEAFLEALSRAAEAEDSRRGGLMASEAEAYLADLLSEINNPDTDPKRRKALERILEEIGAYYIQTMGERDLASIRAVFQSLAKDKRKIPFLRRMRDVIAKLSGIAGPEMDWQNKHRWDALHQLLSGHVARTTDSATADQDSEGDDYTKPQAIDAEVEPKKEDDGQMLMFARSAVETSPAIDAGIARRRAFYGPDTDVSIDSDGKSISPSSLYQKMFGSTGSYAPQLAGYRQRRMFGVDSTPEREAIASAFRSPFQNEAVRSQRRNAADFDRAVDRRATTLDREVLREPMFARGDYDERRESIYPELDTLTAPAATSTILPQLGTGYFRQPKFAGDPKNDMDRGVVSDPASQRALRSDPAVLQLKRNGVAAGMPLRRMHGTIGEKLLDNNFNPFTSGNANNPVSMALDPNQPNDQAVLDQGMRTTLAKMLGDQVDMANELYAFGLVSREEAHNLVLTAKAAANETMQLSEELSEKLSRGAISPTEYSLEMKHVVLPVLAQNFGVTFQSSNLLERVAASDHLSDTSKQTAKSILNSSGGMQENAITHIYPSSALVVRNAYGLHLTYSTSMGMDVTSVDMDSLPRGDVESSIDVILHEATHTATSQTISNTLQEVLPNNPAWRETKGFYSIVDLDAKKAGFLNAKGAELDIIRQSLPLLSTMATATDENILQGAREFDPKNISTAHMTASEKAQLARLRYGSTAFVASDFLLANYVAILNDVPGLLASDSARNLRPDIVTGFKDLRTLALSQLDLEANREDGNGSLRMAAYNFFERLSSNGSMSAFGYMTNLEQVDGTPLLGQYGLTSAIEHVAEFTANEDYRDALANGIAQAQKLPMRGILRRPKTKILPVGNFVMDGAEFDMLRVRDALGMMKPETPVLPDQSDRTMAKLATSIQTNMMSHNMRQDLFFSRRLTGETKPDALPNSQQADFFGALPYSVRRGFEMQAAELLTESWPIIGKDLSVDLLGKVEVVRGWWKGSFNPGMQFFIDPSSKGDAKETAATLAYVLDQQGVGIVDSVRVVNEGERPTGIVVKGPASRRDFDRITKVMQEVFTETGYGEMTNFSFPFDVARKQLGLAYFNKDKEKFITENNLAAIQQRLGDKYEVVGAIIPNSFVSKSEFASGPESLAGRNADNLRGRIRESRNNFLQDRGYKGELFFSRGEINIGGIKFARADINSEAGQRWASEKLKPATIGYINTLADSQGVKDDFGESTSIDVNVTDQQGELITLYHGTRAEFGLEGGDFSRDKFGSFTGATDARAGVFLTTDKVVAQGYAFKSTASVTNVDEFQSETGMSAKAAAQLAADHHQSNEELLEAAAEYATERLDDLGLNTERFKLALMRDPEYSGEINQEAALGLTGIETRSKYFSDEVTNYTEKGKLRPEYQDALTRYDLDYPSLQFFLKRAKPGPLPEPSPELRALSLGELLVSFATRGKAYKVDGASDLQALTIGAQTVANTVPVEGELTREQLEDITASIIEVEDEAYKYRSSARAVAQLPNILVRHRERLAQIAGNVIASELNGMLYDYGIKLDSTRPFSEQLREFYEERVGVDGNGNEFFLSGADPELGLGERNIVEDVRDLRQEVMLFKGATTLADVIDIIEQKLDPIMGYHQNVIDNRTAFNLENAARDYLAGDTAAMVLDEDFDRQLVRNALHNVQFKMSNRLANHVMRAKMLEFPGALDVQAAKDLLLAAENDSRDTSRLRDSDKYSSVAETDRAIPDTAKMEAANAKSQSTLDEANKLKNSVPSVGKVHSLVKAHARGRFKIVDEIESYDPEEYRGAIRDAKDEGFDGLIIKDVDDSMGSGSVTTQVFIVFEPDNVLIQDESHANNPVLFSRFGDGLLDAGVEKSGTIAKGIGDTFRKYFTTTRGLPQGAFRRYMQRKGHIESAQDRAAKRLIDLRQIVAEEYMTADEQATVMAKLNTLLGIPQNVVDGTHYNVTGPHPLTNGMSPRLLATLRSMRDSIDEMSASLKDNLDLPDGLRGKIKDNMGLYVNRSYRLFTEPDWAKNVPQEVKDKFIELTVKEYENMFADQIASGRLDPRKLPTMAAALANSVLMRGSETQSPIAMLSIIQDQNLKGASILMKRRLGDDEYSRALRALMGEETNVFKNYTNTITKMAATIENHRLFADIRGMGIEQGWIVHGDDIPTGEGDQWVAINAPDKFKPDYMLHGLYVKQDVKKALEFLLQPRKTDVGGLMKFIFKANALTKYGKTVLSPLTHSRNFVGNIPHMIANGYFNGNALDTNLREWWRTAAAGNDLFGVTDEVRRERYRRMVELGVVNYGFEVEIEDMIRQSGADETLGTFLTRVGRISRETTGLLSGAVGKAQQYYSFEDDVFKVIAFEIEAGRLKRAHPDKSTDEIEAMAAEIVGQTMPNYEMVPEAVLALRRLPIVGTFPSHTAEMIRTTIGRIRLARDEMRDPNPEIQKAGRNRMLGLGIMLSLPSIAAMAFKSLSGISDEEEKAIRRMLPFWNRNSTLLFQRGENGEIKFTDYGYVDPFVYFRKPIIALLSGRHQSVDEAIFESLEQIMQPFVGQEVFFGAAYEAIRNKDINGRGIVEPGTSMLDKGRALLAHVLSGIEPGIVGQSIDLYRSATNQVNDYGRRYSLANSLLTHATGFKTETINPMQAFMFKLAEFNRLDRELGSRYRASVRTARGVDEEYLRDAVVHYNDARRTLQTDLMSLVGGMRALGYSDSQIRQGLSFGSVSKDMQDSLIEGEFRNFDVPVSALEGAIERFSFTQSEVPFGEPGELEERIQILMEATEELNRPEFRQESEGRASLRK